MSNRTKDMILILLLALTVRLIYIYYNFSLSGDEIKHTAMAISIWQGGVFKTYFNPIDVPRLFLLVFISPWISLTYLITKDVMSAAGITPLLFGTALVLIIYQICFKLYDRKTAVWAGMLASLFPPLVLHSSRLLPEIYYLFCISCGILFLVYFFEKRTSTSLFLSALFFAMAARMHIEGNLVFLFLVFYVLYDAYKWKRSGSTPSRSMVFTAGVMCGAFLLIMLVELIVAVKVIHVPRSSSRALIGILLGKFVHRIQTLFLVKTPGGFLKSNPFLYAAENLNLVWYTLLAEVFDFLKSIFLIPLRIIPPLLLVVFGFSFSNDGLSYVQKRIETFLLLMLPSLLVFPALLIAESRYFALLIPVAIIFLAKGMSRFSEILANRFHSGKMVYAALSLSVFIYLGLYILPDVVSNSQTPGFRRQVKTVAEWINGNVPDKRMPLISYNVGNLALMTNRELVNFEENSRRVDNIWMAHPTTEASRIDSIVKNQGTLLLVFYKRQDDPLESSRRQYFYNLKMSQGAYLLDGQQSFEQMSVDRRTSTPETVDVTESLYVPASSVLLKKFTFQKPDSEWFIYECRGG